MPNYRALHQYLEWALDELGLFSLVLLNPPYRGILVDVTPEDTHWIARFNETVSPNIRKFIEDDPSSILSEAGSQFSSLMDEKVPRSDETLSYHRMLAAMIASLQGNERGLAWLGALLITQPINRKITITYFLGNLTDGDIGSYRKEIPSREQVLNWVDQIRARSVPLKPLIAEVARAF